MKYLIDSNPIYWHRLVEIDDALYTLINEFGDYFDYRELNDIVEILCQPIRYLANEQ